MQFDRVATGRAVPFSQSAGPKGWKEGKGVPAAHLLHPLCHLFWRGWVKCQRRRLDPNPPSLDWLGVALTCLSPYSDLMSLTEIDHWIGKTLFVPPIIKLCQLTRQSQFAVAKLFWFIAALDGFYRAETLLMSIVWGGLSIFMMLSATRRADSPTVSFMFFRLLAITLLMFDLLKGFTTAEWAGSEFWVFVLFAEYAATIRTIPPKEKTKPAARVSAAK